MGPGEQATAQECQVAYQLGIAMAHQGWIVLTGGRSIGVMEAASRGAQSAGGLTLGILPGTEAAAAAATIDIVIPTGMGQARNCINVLTSHVIIACGMGSGTASEVAFALKSQKPVILLECSRASQNFFQELSPTLVRIAETAIDAVRQTRKILESDLAGRSV
jgi:hypothetical protein